MLGTIELLIIVVGAICIAGVVLQAMGARIPAFVVKILWIVFAVCVGIIAIRLISQII